MHYHHTNWLWTCSVYRGCIIAHLPSHLHLYTIQTDNISLTELKSLQLSPGRPGKWCGKSGKWRQLYISLLGPIDQRPEANRNCCITTSRTQEICGLFHATLPYYSDCLLQLSRGQIQAMWHSDQRLESILCSHQPLTFTSLLSFQPITLSRACRPPTRCHTTAGERVNIGFIIPSNQ